MTPDPDAGAVAVDGSGLLTDVHWRWWEPFVVFAISFLVTNVLGATLLLLTPSSEIGADPLQTTLLSALSAGTMLGTTLLWMQLRHSGGAGQLFGRIRSPLRDLAVGFGAGLAAFVVGNVALGRLLTWVVELLGGGPPPQVQVALQNALRDPGIGVLLAILVVIVVPLAEEVLFRGMLFQGLRRYLRLWPAVLLSAVFFALPHIEPIAILLLIPVGVFFAWLFHVSRSLLVPIAAHAAFNLVNVVLLRLAS